LGYMWGFTSNQNEKTSRRKQIVLSPQDWESWIKFQEEEFEKVSTKL